MKIDRFIKRIFTVVLTAALIIGMLPGISAPAYAGDEGGYPAAGAEPAAPDGEEGDDNLLPGGGGDSGLLPGEGTSFGPDGTAPAEPEGEGGDSGLLPGEVDNNGVSTGEEAAPEPNEMLITAFASSDAALIRVAFRDITVMYGAGTNMSPYKARVTVPAEWHTFYDSNTRPGAYFQVSAGAKAFIYSDNSFTLSTTFQALGFGINHVYIEVVAADNTTKQYYDVQTTREPPAYLDSVAGQTIADFVYGEQKNYLKPNQNLYLASITVPNGKTSIVSADLWAGDDCFIPEQHGYGLYSDGNFTNKVSSIALPAPGSQITIYVKVNASALVDPPDVLYAIAVNRQHPDSSGYVCQIEAIGYSTLTAAINALPARNAAITLLTSFDHNGRISMTDKKVTFNLNGKILNIKNANGDALNLNNCEMRLSGTGELNVISEGDNDSILQGYGINIIQGKATVTSAKATGPIIKNSGRAAVKAERADVIVLKDAIFNSPDNGMGYGVYSIGEGTINVKGNVTSTGQFGVYSEHPGSMINVEGNVVHTGLASTSAGIFANRGGCVNIDGTYTTVGSYILFLSSAVAQNQYISPTTKPGYLTYASGGGADGNSKVWIYNPAPGLYGPAAMTLTAGYTYPAYSDYFAVYGRPAPTISKLEGDDRITWDASRRLKIDLGLVPGTYPVKLKAESAAGYIEHNFTLTVIPRTGNNITSVVSPSGAAISGTDISATVPVSTASQVISLNVSSGATWKLFSNFSCTNEITSKTMTLALGANTAYIQVKAENNSTRIYAITITRLTTDFVAVTGITGVPATAKAGTNLTLTGTVAPANATNKTIIWNVKSQGTTGATISGNTFKATAAGTAAITATIANGLSAGTPYKKDFTITVSLSGGAGNKPAAAQFSFSPAGAAFNGMAQAVTVKPGSGVGKVTAVRYNGQPDAPVNAGSYVINVDVAAGTDFSAGTDINLGTFTIYKADLAAIDVTIADMAWTGKQIKPAAFKYNGIDFAIGSNASGIQYGANKNIGSGTVQIAGAGTNFTGSKTIAFNIVPKAGKISKIAAGTKQMTVSWSKVSAAQKISRYEVRYRVKGSESWKTKAFSASASSAVIKKLKKGSQYEVQVRSFKTVSGKKYYSAWSAVKTSKKIK